jgi:fatty-acyl-CoA synthase
MRTIPDLLAKRAELSPDRIALETLGGETLTYAELEARARSCAGLLAALEIGAGDRVAVLCRNRAEFFDLIFACAKRGAILAPLNWRSPVEELSPLIAMIAPKAIFHGAEDADVAGVLSARSHIDFDGDYELRLAAAQPEPGSGWWPPEEAWYLLLTSGTTGRPKAVINTYGMALANAVNVGSAVELTSADRTACYLPLFHAGGVGLYALPALFAGARLILLPGFDVDAAIDLIGGGRLTVFFGVPAIYQQLWEHPRFAETPLDHIRHWGCGGAALPEIMVERFASRGALVCSGMGMTETGPTAFLMDPAAVTAKIGSVGKGQILCRTRLVDPDGEEILEAGVTGEVQFAGSAITPGYWNDPQATAAAFTADGWLKSGDLAWRDADGYYFVVGRSKEMFISGAENVYPVEVENVLLAHPDVAEAAVVGVPDDRWGEVGRAYVTAKKGAVLDTATLDAWCRARLAGYKAPKAYVFAGALPRNALGKVLKHRLDELDG